MVRGITQRFVELGSYHVRAVARFPQSGEEMDANAERLRLLPGVNGVVSELQGFGLLYSETARTGVTIRALEGPFWNDDAAGLVEVVAGELEITDRESIVLGVAVARRLDVALGEEVRVLTVRSLGEGRFLPRVSRFTVSGIVSTGYRDLDRLWTLVSLDRGRQILADESARAIIGVRIDDPYALPNPLFNRGFRSVGSATAEREALAVREAVARVVAPEWHVSDWYGTERARYVSLQTSRNLLVFIMALVLVVAAINISSSLILLVLEKETEIAILRANGAPRGTIIGAFLTAATILGVSGTAIGVVVGLTLAANINGVLAGLDALLRAFGSRVELFSSEFYLETIPVSIDVLPVAASALLAIAISFLASLLPAVKAARVCPDRILRRHA